MQTLSVRQRPAAQAAVPLVVDLDGTVIKTDVLVESFFSLAATKPQRALAALGDIRHGKAAFKARIAAEAELDVAMLPRNEELIALIQAARDEGRPVYLATAADRRLAEAMAGALGLFDGVFASDAVTNLKGSVKAEALVAAFGEGGFDYAGDARADFPVWAKAREVILVGADKRMHRAVIARHPEARSVDPRKPRLRDYARMLRVHQWLKNLLILVPIATAHRFDLAVLPTLVLAFFSFSFCASSVYLANDLVDLNNDRAHSRKRHRPLAAGRVKLTHAVMLAPTLLVASFLLALPLPSDFLLLLGGYYSLTTAYSLWLKRKVTVDVLALACLYGVRLVAGGIALNVALSPWLVAFSIFLFLCLALVKRCTELVDRIAKGRGDPAGRGYILRDLPMLEMMAAGTGYVAIMVFALYVNSPVVESLYHKPEYLWAICLVLFYWISRILLMTHRGEMHDDPVVYAATDWRSLVCGGLIMAIGLAAL